MDKEIRLEINIEEEARNFFNPLLQQYTPSVLSLQLAFHPDR